MITIHVYTKMNAIYFMYNEIQFFVSMYNDTTSTNNNYFVIQLQEEVVNLT